MRELMLHLLSMAAAWLALQGVCPLPSICDPPSAAEGIKAGRFAVTTSWHP